MSKPDKILVVARDAANPPSPAEFARLAILIEDDGVASAIGCRVPIDIFQRIDGVWSYVGPKDLAAVERVNELTHAIYADKMDLVAAAERLPDETTARIREHCCKDATEPAGNHTFRNVIFRGGPADGRTGEVSGRLQSCRGTHHGRYVPSGGMAGDREVWDYEPVATEPAEPESKTIRFREFT